MSEYALPYEEAWISKLLQAVVGWRSPKLSLEQGRFVSIFRFQPSIKFSINNGQDILDTFLSLSIGGEEPIHRFCLALHSIRSQEKLSFLLVVRDVNKEPMVFKDGVHFPNESLVPKLLKPFGSEPGVVLAVSHLAESEKKFLRFWRPSTAVKKTASIFQRLCLESQASPIPLQTDMFSLVPFDSSPKASQPCVALFSLKAKSRLADELDVPTCLLPMLRGQVGKLWERKVKLNGYALLRYSKKPEPSEFSWIEDGVVLERGEFCPPGPFQLTLFVNASGLLKDLSGLRLSDSPKRMARLREVMAALDERLNSFKAKADDFYLPGADPFGKGIDGWAQAMPKVVDDLEMSLRNVCWDRFG